MPPIIADSDDDGDDIITEPDSPAVGNSLAATAQDLEATNKQSTGSTERIRRDIREAERALFANSAEMAPQAQSSGSPAAGAQKRRHSIVVEKRASLSPEKRVKRSKTQMTYSKTKQRASAPMFGDEDSFAAFRDDEPAVATSRSARFTEHSAAQSSARLPDGTIRDGFIDNDPQMFKDSGSTAVDNESSQQRMIEEALNKKKGGSLSELKAVEATEHKSSSSFPWSASEQTQSARKAAEQKRLPSSQARAEEAEPSKEAQASPSQPWIDATGAPERTVASQPPTGPAYASGSPDQDTEPAVVAVEEGPLVLSATHSSQDIAITNAFSKPKSSPIVRIAVHAPTESLPMESVAEPAQKSTRGRKRKAQAEDSEPLNSEDRAVGLPKERYVPRLSRRRATQAPEEPIDFSVQPEKAAKAKRRKTVAGPSGAGAKADGDPPLRAASKASPPSQDAGYLVGPAKVASPAKSATSAEVITNDNVVVQEQQELKGDLDPPPKSQAPSAEAQSQPSPVPKADDDEVFVKPTPKLTLKLKAKPSAKARRSHTTIFEDHVAFDGSQRTPTLSQQQTKRQMALQTADDNVGLQTQSRTQKPRRKVVDSDDEDEMAASEIVSHIEPVNEAAEEPPPEPTSKKRGRGRPAKSNAKAKAKSAEKVLEDSDAEAEVEAEVASESEEPPKKKGRGRAAKSATTTETTTESADDRNALAATDGERLKEAAVDKENLTTPTPAKQTAIGTQGPTPSPEKPAAAAASGTPQKPAVNGSPVSHSPLKSSLTVPLRVGLSKRQRIPPLLRVMKPPKR